MIKKIILVLGLVLILAPAPSVGAINAFDGCSGNSDSKVCRASGEGEAAGNRLMRNVVNTLMLILGAVSTIMIVIGGIRYASSHGDSNQIAAAKNTILYAVIGLVVAILASAVVNFVLERLG